MDIKLKNRISEDSFMYMFHHVFLPPQVPQKDDHNLQHEKDLLDFICDVLQTFKAAVNDDQQDAVRSASDMMESFRSVRDQSGGINKSKLKIALQKLSNSDGVVPLHVGAQNAGVLISKVGQGVCFEAFELSPDNQSVITTRGRLRRSFPGAAFVVNQSTFEDDGFQATIAQTIAKMSHQPAPGMQPKVSKAGDMLDESRDTTKPNMVTEHLMSFVRATGKSAQVSTIWKNTREEILWLDCKSPWRRSAMWLLIRVALQLRFSRLPSGSALPGELYKTFMVFYMAYILQLSNVHSPQSEVLFSMTSKVSRRLVKLGSKQAKPWINMVQQAMSTTHHRIQTRWQNIADQTCPRLDLEHLGSIEFKEDVGIDLRDLDHHIVAITSREGCWRSSRFQPTSALPEYPQGELPFPVSDTTEDFHTHVFASFESWVERNLADWLDLHISEQMTCGKLRSVIESYHRSAIKHYANNPEGYSVMYLTIVELWIACDRSACFIYHMLLDYSPEIPVELLQSLLLPFKSQMQRLSDAERYLRSRHTKAKLPAVFYGFGESSTFSVKFFDRSPQHQTLLFKIQDEASHQRNEKLLELSRKKHEYQELMRLCDETYCDFYEHVDQWTGHREQIHSDSCEACSYKIAANSISIFLHEWPLPSDPLETKSVVFELNAPPAFCEWRDATMFVLVDVFECEDRKERRPCSHHALQNYSGLCLYFACTGSTKRRVGLLSQDKPTTRTHRRDTPIMNKTENDVCVKNGLRFQYHDSDREMFIDSMSTTENVSDNCTYKLPARSSALQKFLARPPSKPNGLPPNTVIARQSDCPTHMSLNEYRAFGTLPLGYRSQWMNVLIQLAAPSVDFSKIETSLLLLQILHQAGLPGKIGALRASHEDLSNIRFCHALLAQLRDALHRLKENWDASQALAAFTNIAARLLSLAPSREVQEECLEYLAGARGIAYDWVKVIRSKSQQSIEEAHKIELLAKAVEVALICANTFHVDQNHLDDILCSPSQASIFLQSSIFIQERLLSMRGISSSLHVIMLERWKKLCHRALPVITREIEDRSSLCLDDAIHCSWSDYEAGSKWQAMADPHAHWLFCKTAFQYGMEPLAVHFNLLTAELLVNGLPIARLPPEYEKHQMYIRLFGHSTLEVVPSRVPGMDFSGTNPYAGYNIHFNMSSSPESDLVLHAVQNDQKYDLIPSRIFRHRFPIDFVDNFVHWFNHADASIEFRPIDNPWPSAPANWRLTEFNGCWRLARVDVTLISALSGTAEALAAILLPLENRSHIHIFFREASQSLEIELPRLQLAFHIEPGSARIYSRQFRGMYIDPDQDIETLIGLQNKLVLKKGYDRLVAIPEGRVKYQKTCEHVKVSIDADTVTRVHTYNIDKRLGRVMDNGSLQSKLYLCYLHGLTSYCLPDPLTQRTGTEQALSVLGSAAVRSFGCLAESDLAILQNIARLSPGRSYYPKNKRVMQAVGWDPNISFFSQHGSFVESVRAIFEQAEGASFLYSDIYIKPPRLDFVDQHLLDRDFIRSSTFRASGFGAELHDSQYDVEYTPRDRGQNSENATRSFVVCSMLFLKRGTLHCKSPSSLQSSLWRLLKPSDTISGPGEMLGNALLKYDSAWLEKPIERVGPLWCIIHSSLGHSPHMYNKFRIMMWLSTMSFAEDIDMQVIYALVAFYNVPEVGQLNAPPLAEFKVSEGVDEDISTLLNSIRSRLRPLSTCPEANLSKENGESNQKFNRRRQNLFDDNQKSAIQRFAKALQCQWPCETPQTPIEDTFSTYLKTEQIMGEVKVWFKTWYDNRRFYEYLDSIASTLRRQTVESVATPHYNLPVRRLAPQTRRGYISIDDVFVGSAPSINSVALKAPGAGLQTNPQKRKSKFRLETLLDQLEAQISTESERDYAANLRDSLESLRNCERIAPLNAESRCTREALAQYLAYCNRRVNDTYTTITDFGGEEGAVRYRHGPRICPAFFLQQLSRTRWDTLTTSWKDCIVKYALSLSELQRAERLLNFANNATDLGNELSNIGHQNWNPSEFPESLLFEVESGIMIREVQEDIANQMRNPPSNKNSVMQLNMGEGKSSVIVPMVAASLADGTQLVRVITAKAQSKQMFQMLVSTVGGLINRRIYHLPFSRALKLDIAGADAIGRICRECMENGGILLVQPEHILSFGLMGIECQIAGRHSVAESLVQTQYFFDTASRDMVDESDENFSVKFELIYTIGTQRPVEHSPARWTIIQMVLGLVARFVPEVKRKFPLSVEVDCRWSARFPRTRLLRPGARELLMNLIADHICNVGFHGFPVPRQSQDIRMSVHKYITEPTPRSEDIAGVECASTKGFWTEPLLLIRGLIAGGILNHAFGSKRWRVNYGLDPDRVPQTKLAVPFRAKDNPSQRSEFSHPDVVIVLTCLSYYYGGLTDVDLFDALGHLLKSNQALIEYEQWVQTAPDLPDTFHQLVGINIKDSIQCIEKVFPALRFAKGVIDYFLSHLVFPKEMKEFPSKISSSGWDIGKIKLHPTTGFSGTNDSRHVLPLDVHHLDLPEQKHTNALVLEYILQDENSVELLNSEDKSVKSDAELLLSTVIAMEPVVRVVLDVGAQILELSNQQVAQEWLNMSTDCHNTQAVVFVNDKDELSVLDRRGRIELLQISPFAKQLDLCLVFLDDAHTRGIDLKLPPNYRAAVTLGANLTKDRLIQACMRMRKLGKGQSLVFLVPEEVKTSIRGQNSKQSDSRIDVLDVLAWAILGTHADLRRSMPLWAIQGQRHEGQKLLWEGACKDNGYYFSKGQAQKFLEAEAQTLDYRYRPLVESKSSQFSGWDSKNPNIARIIERCQNFAGTSLNRATLEEEQERELSPEIEQESQVERPAPLTPWIHSIHDDLILLVKTGEFRPKSKAFLPAFESLRTSSAAAHLDVSQFPQDVFVTADFASTVQPPRTNYLSDAYQQHVQWIITTTSQHSDLIQNIIVLSPYEVQELRPRIGRHAKITLHLYAPRPSLEFRPLDALDLFTEGKAFDAASLPRKLTIQLNLFAGQLYMFSFAEYIEICKLLGLTWSAVEDGVVSRADGFVTSGPGKGMFKDSPVKFLRALVTTIRRDCEEIEKTHLGKVLHGGLLDAKADFDG